MSGTQWVDVASVDTFPKTGALCYRHGDLQVAIYTLRKEEWYATQNLCPHQQQMVLSRGLLGDKEGTPKVACPLHKHAFDLKSGRHLGGDESWNLATYPVRIDGDQVQVELPTLN